MAWLNPYATDFASQVKLWRQWLQQYSLRSVIEPDARFLLDRGRSTSQRSSPRMLANNRGGSTSTARDRLGQRTQQRLRLVVVRILHDKVDSTTAWARLISGLEQVVRHAERAVS